ncbi:hypothetical protein HMPREF9162_2206 [Selenomonas sp. oral taxon 137 str. F0430]|nr:hypothetical protein HMPREF9162_2206 [Selenomonas sp. oral taxon 137 str. F0430]
MLKSIYASGGVSIHAPRAGRDFYSLADIMDIASFNPRAPCGARPRANVRGLHRRRFNPRAPCGARHISFLNPIATKEFQSTRPVRGATP